MATVLPGVAPVVAKDGLRRVLIVDDSVVARAVIGGMIAQGLIAQGPRFVVAGAVGTVAAALAFLAVESVDVILLDIQMPGVDGLTALPDLLAASKNARIVVVSSSAGQGAANTIRALALGAADTLEKPTTSGMSKGFGAALAERLHRLFDTPATRLPPVPAPSSPPLTNRAAIGDDFDIVAIGASTGGIHALGRLLKAIPPGFQLPILVTQHLPASFMPYFAAQLAVLADRPCDVAVERLRIRPGRIIVAPGDGHMRCVALSDGQAAVRLSTEPAVSHCMPSVDPMFASLAEIYGPRLLAVVLSGMGRDGAEGARRVRDTGGCVVVQDQSTSVVWGMPGAIAAQGIAHAILPPDEIGKLIGTRRRA
ncbi:chemotaxis protein CheB [Sphingomonas sp. Leaf343]|uniref:chemotaxis protein CheB n=1 Tax=Sphingomonas sp. Leaf343 TaxID=1736345 RepID=UPI0006F33A93|nr:chemotaxis protein CheB [Sphingomonas sp. Leaf343]KQR81264.1 chemotaxis protein CheB [Sphingomonas sp. Leaf343]